MLYCQTPWPSWVFTHWVWENEGTTQSARQLVDDYLAHDIPVGAIIIDSPWETGYNTFEFDTMLYPDAQEMIDYFHSKNVRVFLWITSMINVDVPLYSYAYSQDYFMLKDSTKDSTVISWWKGDGSLIDFFNPDAVAWWKTLMDKALAMGIDGWKCDGTDFSAWEAPYSPYLGTTVTRNQYSEQYYRLFHDYTRQVLGNDRVITARPIDNYGYDWGGPSVAFAPVDITWSGWVGDQDATFDGLVKALNNMYHSSQYGYLSFGSDIGGFRFDDNYPVEGRTKEVLIRWAQMGAFCPIMENGGNGEHRPWMFDAQANDIYRQFVLYHHALIPYLIEQADTAFKQGKSLMTFFNKTDYSYLLGTEIFVTPILTNTTSANVTFPDTVRWIYLFDTAQKFIGGQTVQLNVPLEEFPVFIKNGSDVLDTLLTGVSREKNIQKFAAVIFPNPATTIVNLQSGLPVPAAFQVFDISMKKVLEITISDSHVKIPLENLDSGLYFYRITTHDNNRSATGKFVVE